MTRRAPRWLLVVGAALLAAAVVGMGINVWHALHWVQPPQPGEVRHKVFDQIHLGEDRNTVVRQLATQPENRGVHALALPAAGLACDEYDEYPPDSQFDGPGYVNGFQLCYRSQILVFKAFIDNNNECGYGISSIATDAMPKPCPSPH